MSLSADQTSHLLKLFQTVGEKLNVTIDCKIEAQEDLDLEVPYKPLDMISTKPLYYDIHVLVQTGDQQTPPIFRDTLASFHTSFGPDTYDFLVEFAATMLKHPPIGMPFDTNRGEMWRNIAWSNLKNNTSL